MEKPPTLTMFCQRCDATFSIMAVGQKIPEICPQCAYGAIPGRYAGPGLRVTTLRQVA